MAFLISMSDLRKMADIAQGLDPRWILLAIASAILSFGAFGLAFVSVIWRLIKRSAFFGVLKIGYVSFTFSELLVSAGLSGYAVRSVMLSSYGISYLETLIYSLTRACIHYFVIFVIFILTVSLFLSSIPEGIGRNVVIFQCCLFGLLLAYGVRVFFSATARNRWVRLVGFGLNSLSKLRGKGQILEKRSQQRVEDILNRAVKAMMANRWRILWPIAFEFIGMGLRLMTLYAGFRACSYVIDPAIMVAGFIIGTFWVFFVQLPGQLGFMEGAVSATYTAFGLPFEIALGACVMYRLTYSLIPFLVGFLFLPRLASQTLSTFFKGNLLKSQVNFDQKENKKVRQN